MRLAFAFGAGVGFGSCLLLIAGCTNGGSEAPAGVQAALVGTCQVGAVCPLEIPMPGFPIPVAVTATERLVLAPQASVIAPDSKPAALVNSGTGETVLAPEARAGGIWAKGPVTLAPRARVDGPLVATGPVTLGPEAVAPAATAPTGTPAKVTINVTFPAGAAPNVAVGNNQSKTLAPGRYGAVTVGTNATLNVAAGAYFLESLTIGAKSKLQASNLEGTTALFVRGAFGSQGQIVSLGKPADIFIASFGGGQVRLTADLAATVVALNAEIVLDASVRATGMLVARVVTMAPASKVTRTAISGTGPAAGLLKPVFTPSPDQVLPPKPTPVGKAPADYLTSIDTYLDGVVAAGFNGKPIEFEAHPELKGEEDMTALNLGVANRAPAPKQGSAEGSVSTGLSNVITNVPEADLTKPLPPPEKPKPKICPLADATVGSVLPTNIHVPLTAGDPPKPGALFDAYWFADGGLDASVNGLLFSASANPAFHVGGVLFGSAPFDVLFATATASGVLGLQGDQAKSSFSADAFAKLGPFETPHHRLGGSSQRTLQVDLCGSLCDHPTSLLPTPITIPMGPVVLSINGFLESHIPLAVQADESGPMITVSPVLRAYVQASLSIPFIPEPSIEGQLDLIRLDAPIMARMRWEVNQSPEVCAVRLLADSKYNVTISSLNGRIFLVLKLVIFNPFGDNLEIELARIEVLSFDGISFSTGYKDLFTAQILPSIPLDANQCLVGGLGCTEMAPDRVFMPPPTSSVPGQGDTGRDYGSDQCPGQFVWELPVEPDVHLVGFVMGADIGDISDAEAPCEQRKAAITMWQHVNGAWTEATRFRLVGGRTPGGKCMVTAVNRSAPNPIIPGWPAGNFYNTLPDSEPFQRFPFVPGMDKIRIAMAAAVGCTPLPLSFSPAMLRVF